jgi:hypothetical protein
MELEFERTISTNGLGSNYLCLPKQVVKAFGTKEVIVRIKNDCVEVIPKKP